MTAPTIVRILAVQDTRQYEEQGDRWVPIPGSGQERECDRCHRTHEIHIDVELSDGTVACIGQGCARGESMDTVSRIKSGISAAITRARIAAQLARFAADHARALAGWDATMRLPLPDLVLVTTRTDLSEHRGPTEIWAHKGDESHPVWCFTKEGGLTDERKRCLAHGWRQRRYSERDDVPRHRWGAAMEPSVFDSQLSDLRRRLARVEHRLKEMTS